MNDDQARITRIFQYILANDVFLKQDLIQKHNRVCKKSPSSDDISKFWVAMIKYDLWQEFSRDVWNLLK